MDREVVLWVKGRGKYRAEVMLVEGMVVGDILKGMLREVEMRVEGKVF